MIHGGPSELEAQIAHSVDLVREISGQTDPQEMVRRYAARSRRHYPGDASLSLSRRGLTAPKYRITRSSGWSESINPWKQPGRLPLLSGGVLADCIYSNEVRVFQDLRVDERDPAADYLRGFRSMVALPLYDHGESLNMVTLMMHEPNAARVDLLPDQIVTANLFGWATHNLVLADELRHAYQALDAEFRIIADIQRSLLPAEVPVAPGLELAAHYRTAHRAGGDYYDCIPLDGARTGVLIADVSGHGAAAALVMARVHATVHANPDGLQRPGKVLQFINDRLLMQCRRDLPFTTFVTAFYGVYDANERSLVYASAGHNPPRLRRRDGSICSISGAREIPLAIDCGVRFDEACLQLERGDEMVLYTDGIVEAADRSGDQFGTDRLDDAILAPHGTAGHMVENIVGAVDSFIDGQPLHDDNTLLALAVA